MSGWEDFSFELGGSEGEGKDEGKERIRLTTPILDEPFEVQELLEDDDVVQQFTEEEEKKKEKEKEEQEKKAYIAEQRLRLELRERQRKQKQASNLNIEQKQIIQQAIAQAIEKPPAKKRPRPLSPLTRPTTLPSSVGRSTTSLPQPIVAYPIGQRSTEESGIEQKQKQLKVAKLASPIRPIRSQQQLKQKEEKKVPVREVKEVIRLEEPNTFFTAEGGEQAWKRVQISGQLNFKTLETYTLLRLQWMDVVVEALSSIPINSCLNRGNETSLGRGDRDQRERGSGETSRKYLDDVLDLVGSVKSGSYGTVLKAHLKYSLDYNDLEIAVKHVKLANVDDINIVRNTYIEVLAMSYVNYLVQLRLAPHYPLLYKPYLCHRAPPHQHQIKELNIVEEFSQADLQHFIKSFVTRPSAEIMSLIFQVCVGILVAQVTLAIVNNDIKANNILINDIEKNSFFYYNIYGTKYLIPTFGRLFKIADWGLATGIALKRDHSYAPNLIPEEDQVILPSFDHKKAYESGVYGVKHPLSYRDTQKQPIPPFKRDYLFFLYMMRSNISTLVDMDNLDPIVNWLSRAIGLVANSPDETTEQKVNLFKSLFSVDAARELEFNDSTYSVRTGDLPSNIPDDIILEKFEVLGYITVKQPTTDVIAERARQTIAHLNLTNVIQ